MRELAITLERFIVAGGDQQYRAPVLMSVGVTLNLRAYYASAAVNLEKR